MGGEIIGDVGNVIERTTGILEHVCKRNIKQSCTLADICGVFWLWPSRTEPVKKKYPHTITFFPVIQLIECVALLSYMQLVESFKKDGNKLEPIYTLKELLTNTNPEQFLVKNSVQFGANILTWGALIVSVISAVAAVLSIPTLQWLWSYKISF